MLLDIVAEAFYDGLSISLGLPSSLVRVSSRKILHSSQQGANCFNDLDDKLPSVIGEQIRREAVRVHPGVQKHVEDSCGCGSPERYRADQFREPVVVYQHELVSTLCLR